MNNTDIKRTKRIVIITLLLAVPLLTELLSGNTALPKIVNPLVFGYFIIMYGFPVILVREAAAAWKLGLSGIFVLGLAYGIFNEGIAARTLMLSDEHMFMSSLRGYSTFGINLPWAVAILPWHALCSIVYPIALISGIYPQIAGVRILSRRTIITLTMGAAMLGTLSYSSTTLYPGTPVAYLVFFWCVILGLILFARLLPNMSRPMTSKQLSETKRGHLGAFLFGVSLIILFLTPLILAATGLPLYIQLGTTLTLLFVEYRLFMKRYGNIPAALPRIAIGNYVVLSLIAGFVLGPVGWVGETLVWILLFIAWRGIRKREKMEKSS